MQYLAFACDYDGTLATDGDVPAPTIASLERLRATGCQLVLVTGRELGDLLQFFGHLHLFDRAVLENGALLHTPATGRTRTLGRRPPDSFSAQLAARGVQPLAVGEVIVATTADHTQIVFETIQDLGLELDIHLNKRSLMVLPRGINKATGLIAALNELALSPHHCVGIGDAENDIEMLSVCECAVSVANAVSSLKLQSDIVTAHARGEGVSELIEQLLASDIRTGTSRT